MNRLERKLKRYIKSLDKDIERLEETNFETSINMDLMDLSIATALRDVKEDLIEIIGGELSE